jgi:RND family efflux transporter MFP subunit
VNSIVDTASVRPAKSSGQRRQARFTLIILGLVIVGVGAAYQMLIPSHGELVISDYTTATVVQQDLVQTAQASGTTQIPTQMIIRSPQEGYSATLLVDLGDSVKKGDAIATISVPDLDEDIEDLEADLLDAEIALKRLQLQYENSVANAEDGIAQLNNDITDLQIEQAKYQRLVEINNARQSDLDAIEDQLDDKIEQLKDAERELAQSKSLHVLDEASSEAQVAQYQTRLNRAIVEKEETTIRNTMDGEILDIADELSVPGSYLSNGTTLFTVADSSSSVFDLEISEEYSSLIALGDRVPVTVGSSLIYGTITSIGKLAQTSSDGLGATVQVTVTPEQAGDYLAGSTAIGVFTLGVQEDALTLPRGAYLTTGAQKYVYVLTSKNSAEKRTVTFGEIEGNTVQINSGLDEGDVVIVSGYENFISQSTVKLAGE